MRMDTFDILAIDRHRLLTDGKGVTTLVALSGCPLHCSYCINKEILSKNKVKKMVVDELIELVMQDYCYFAATGGGVTFGGGEPLLHYEAIMAFMQKTKDLFATTIETSLCLDLDVVELLRAASQLIIDVKSIDHAVYRKYTGSDNNILLSNLEKISRVGMQDKCVIKIPDIKDHTTQKDIEYSVNFVKGLGFEEINRLIYRVKA